MGVVCPVPPIEPSMQRFRSLTILASVIIGIAIGLGAYTFLYAQGYSYLTNNSAACANCQAMQAQYDGLG